MDDTGVFTYDSSLPTPRDRMRNLVGDTNPTKPLRWDETYDQLLEYYGNETVATAKLARALAAEFGRKPSSVSIPGGPSISYSGRVSSLLDLAKSMEAAVGVTAGESSYLGVRGTRDDGITDVVPTNEFRRDWTTYLIEEI